MVDDDQQLAEGKFRSSGGDAHLYEVLINLLGYRHVRLGFQPKREKEGKSPVAS